MKPVETDHFAIQGAEINHHEIIMDLERIQLHGDIAVPQIAKGMILFAHGSGSSRFSPRNRLVAERFNEAGFATCLFDLLTPEEEQDVSNRILRFDIGLLAERLVQVTDWMEQLLAEAKPDMAERLPLGYFGASTGAASAIVAAADRPKEIKAVVSRGGRPDLASQVLHRVQSPTLLLVGESDELVTELNRKAYYQLPEGNKELVIIPGASHLFEEPGKLEAVTEYAIRWFETYLK